MAVVIPVADPVPDVLSEIQSGDGLSLSAAEVNLVAQMNEERATAIAARLYADEGLVQRIARAESHLSRELDRVLAMLSRLQSERQVELGNGSRPSPIGFVLSNGVSGSGAVGPLDPLSLPGLVERSARSGALPTSEGRSGSLCEAPDRGPTSARSRV